MEKENSPTGSFTERSCDVPAPKPVVGIRDER